MRIWILMISTNAGRCLLFWFLNSQCVHAHQATTLSAELPYVLKEPRHHAPTASCLQKGIFPSSFSKPIFFPMVTSKKKAALKVSGSTRNISPNTDSFHYKQDPRGCYNIFYLASGCLGIIRLVTVDHKSD